MRHPGPTDSTAHGIRSDYDATTASDCYLIGTFADETGLFEYTDDTRCYYAS